MNITVEKQPNCVARLRVEVPAEVVTGERKQIVHAFSRQAKIPGYRPGKVPQSVIEKRFASQITEELETRARLENERLKMSRESIVSQLKVQEARVDRMRAAYELRRRSAR